MVIVLVSRNRTTRTIATYSDELLTKHVITSIGIRAKDNVGQQLYALRSELITNLS